MTSQEDWLELEEATPPRPPDVAKPLVDPAVLERLMRELDDDREGYARIFVADFIGCLPYRVERLRLALTTGDWEAAVDAALSLKTSSQMVGAERLAALASDLEKEVRGEASRFHTAAALPKLAAAFLTPIAGCGHQTAYGLETALVPAEAVSPQG